MAEPADDFIQIRPIGVVRNEVPGDKYEGWEAVTSRILLRPQYAEALAGLEEFSHVEVVLWFHRAHRPSTPRIHPRDQTDLPLVGFLATRTPNRPNPLAVSVARLLSVEGSALVVQGLDAFDGTPVLDVKPYLPRPDVDAGATTPAWLSRGKDGHR